MRLRLRSTTFTVLLSLVASVLAGMPPAAAAPGDGGKPDVSVPMSARPKMYAKAHAAPPAFHRPEVVWPTAGAATVDIPSAAARGTATSGSATIGGLPVKVIAADAPAVADVMTSHGPIADPSFTTGSSVTRVSVTVLDRATAQRLGAAVVFTAARADGASGTAPVTFDIDYAKFGFGFGADYGHRLRLVMLPSCALTESARRECADQQPAVDGRNNAIATTVSGTVDLAAPPAPPVMASANGGQGGGVAEPEPMVLALTSGSSSESGDFTASTLNQSSSWAAGSNSGDFTTTVPLTVAPAPGGLVPSIALNYSSGSVDGLTKSTNTQAPWTGEGWSLSGVSFVERSYRSCKDDGVSYTGGDLCWVGVAPVSIVLNGQSTRLIDNSGNGWKAEDDSLGWKVERLTGANGNGARDGEYFKVTTMDGTQHFFGYRPRGEYGGVQRVEVFGNNPGEPCYIGTNFNANHCPQAYRWNLDKVVDRFGNTMDYNWHLYEGNYGMNRNTTAVTYDITSTLASIEYGANINVAGSTPTGKVTFAQGFRCFYGDCAHTTDPSVWMDTPWDQRCETWATSCPGLYAPTFWTLYRLDEIKSSVWDAGIGGWATVDFIAPSYGFPSTGDYISPSGDDTSPSLWAWKIWLHNRPPIDISGIRLANRVFWGNDLNRAPMNHYRIEWLKSGSGQTTTVTYSGQECTRTNVYDGASDHNPRRCFPQYEDDQYRWYHKYVVNDVVVEDTVGGSPIQRWHYDYSTAAASSTNGAEWASALWHYDDNWLIPANRRAFSQWRGYTNVKTTHGTADGTGPQQVTENIYYRGMNGDRTTAGGFGTRNVTFSDWWDHNIVDHEAMQGKLRRSMVFDGRSGVWTSAVRHIPTITQTGGMYMGGGTPDIISYRALETTTITQTVMAGPTYRLTQVDATYDSAYPIPTFVKDHGDIGDPAVGTSDDRCTATSYVTADLTKYLVSFPKQTFTTTCAATLTAADYLGGSQYFYDGSTVLGFLGTGANAKGLLTKTNALKTSTAAPPQTTDFIETNRATFDVYGRTLDAFDGLNRKTSTVYTPAQGGPATTVAVTTPPPSGTGAGFTTSTTMDVRWSVPVTVSDPNGRITRVEYDAGGRLLKVWKNHRAASSTSSVTPDIEYSYLLRDNGPNYVSTKTLTHTGTQIESFAVFDGLLRPRRSETVAATGSGRTVADTRYDTVGSVDKKLIYFNASAPNPNLDSYTEADVPSLQRFLYDNQGRVLRDQLLAGAGPTIWETIYTYDGDKTVTMQPPSGGTATTTVNNARGKTVELRQHFAGSPTAAVDVTTKYAYDRLSQLKQVTDTANNTWTYTYDLLGRTVSTVDPDAGSTVSKFDNAGQLIETVDANNNKLAYKYDLLGRKTELREDSLTGTLRASWSYDTATLADGVTPAKGHPASTSRLQGGNTYTSAIGSYNNAYQPLSTTDTIPGFGAPSGSLTYTVTSGYHANGALDWREVPAVGGLPQEKITHTYHAPTGLPDAATSNVNGGTTYIASTSYFYDSKSDTVILGGTGRRIKQTSAFDAATRRLTNNTTATETTTVGTYSTKLSDTYTYDNAGHIKSIAGQTNGVADQEECFTYDHLRRLTEAWTQTSGTCATPQRTGTDPYRRQWPTSGGYDKLGNRLKQIDKDTTDTTWNYTIGGVDSCGGASKPHAVTTVTATGPKAGTPIRSFCYDQAGNTTQRTTDTGVVQTLTWDKEGHLATIADGTLTTSYIYDSSGRRLVASNANKTILYLPDGTELEKPSTGTILGQRYYGGAVRDAAGLKWIILNHQGTSTAQIDSLTLTVNRRRSMPFGEPRGTQPSWLGTKGYVGGTKDDTGLTHLGAREYDPTTGRFISVDPIMDLTDPQQWNAYTYSNSNPSTWSDPSGQLLCGDGDCNQVAIPNPSGGYSIKGKSKSSTGGVPTFPAFVEQEWGTHISNISDARADYLFTQYFCTYISPEICAAQQEAAHMRDMEQRKAFILGLVGVTDAQECYSGNAGACAWTAAGLVPIGKLGRLANLGKSGDKVGGAGFFCSFTGETQVLMADGTSKPISEIKVGDEVMATDPETGDEGPRQVTTLWIHEDDVVQLDIGGYILETTEDHPFWNATDNEWQRADALNNGDSVLTATGSTLAVRGIVGRLGAPATMYNLTVSDIHTYYVLAGSTPVLVHNTDTCDLYHGTDAASAANIAAHGLDPEAARRLGGGNVFWMSNDRSTADFFALANPAEDYANPAVVGITIEGGIGAAVRDGVISPWPGLPGAFVVNDWEAMNRIATFEVLS